MPAGRRSVIVTCARALSHGLYVRVTVIGPAGDGPTLCDKPLASAAQSSVAMKTTPIWSMFGVIAVCVLVALTRARSAPVGGAAGGMPYAATKWKACPGL